MPPSSQRDPSQRGKPKFEVEKRDGGFVVVDGDGVVHGPPAKDRRGAEETLKDWKAYYAAKEPTEQP
jgi:hypothetical protein